MPAFEIMFPRLIVELQREEVLAQLQGLLAPGDDFTLTQILDELHLIDNDGQREFIDQTPKALQVAILAVVRENLGRGTPKQMMFTWEPSYDWELRLRESTSSSVSAGGITMQIGSRYPDDPHPGQTQLA